MTTSLDDQLDVIKYFRIIESAEQGRSIKLDEAAEQYIKEGYPERYKSIWYSGISLRKLKEEMFSDYDIQKQR